VPDLRKRQHARIAIMLQGAFADVQQPTHISVVQPVRVLTLFSECLVTAFGKAQNFISKLCPIGFRNDVIVHNHILLFLLFQFFPVSAGKGNGVRAPLKAVGNSREVSGTIGKRAIRSIGSHLRFPAPSSSFVAKTMQASAEERSLILCRAQLVLCKINIGHFLFHHFPFKWQLVAL